ncbi:hypothetical protein M8J76_010986 [Diaphorina citri]|nr:hypothetical protein M8J76_010986 [Diaphorina citri]
MAGGTKKMELANEMVPTTSQEKVLASPPPPSCHTPSQGEYDWVSDGPLYDSGFIDNDGPLKKKLHPPQLSLELLSLPIGFPESIQGPLVILSTSAMTDLDSTFNTPVNTSAISSDFFDDGPLKKNLHPSQPSYGLFSATFGFAKSSQVPFVTYSSSSSSTSQPTVIDDVPANAHQPSKPS